jgi:ComF family protein
MLHYLFDLLFPARSPGGAAGAWLTEEEGGRLRTFPLRLEGRPLRERGVEHLDRIVAAGRYATPLLRQAIRTYKYTRVPSLAEPLGDLLIPASYLLGASGDVGLCPIPLHWSRLFDRGFNQSELLAREVSRTRGWPVLPLLKRVRATGSQAQRSHAERKEGVARAFAVRSEDMPLPRHVVLVDDIATTGSTLDACACALKDRGVCTVEALVLALGEKARMPIHTAGP